MGHAAAILSSSMLVHGGRTAPDQPLGDLWLLNLAKPNHSNSSTRCSVDEEGARWVRVDAEGTPPSPRHRHSAVSVGGSLKVGPWVPATLLHFCTISLCFIQPRIGGGLTIASYQPCALMALSSSVQRRESDISCTFALLKIYGVKMRTRKCSCGCILD